MVALSVTVVSCVYGRQYAKFIPRWADAVAELDPAPDAVVVATDTDIEIPGARFVESFCHWRHRQAWYLQKAVNAAETDWVWIVDIDDIALPDGLCGLDEVAADVWAVGYKRSDGELFLPPRLTASDVLASPRSEYAAGSMIRTDIFHDCGGFPDVALQDWALWRRLARHGAIFEPSDRPHFKYMRHPQTRGETELTLDVRADHLAEMMEAELAYA